MAPSSVGTPIATVTINDPPASPLSTFFVNSDITVKGSVTWTPATPGFVTAIRLALLRASDGTLITPGGLAVALSATADGFTWRGSFNADKAVADGLIRAIALDASLNEVAHADVPVQVNAPSASVTIDRPASDASFGIDSAIDIAGSATWTAVIFPEGSNFDFNPPQAIVVDSVRVSLLRKSTMGVVASGTASITEPAVGSFKWEKVLIGDQGVSDGLIRAAAIDDAGNELTHTDIDVVIEIPAVTLQISSPATSPISSQQVNSPITVEATLAWTTSSPSFVKDVLIQLVRKADAAVVATSHGKITPVAAGTASVRGSVSTADHLIDATIRVLAFDKFSNVVAQQEVQIRVP